ncbi:MAG TPA: thaumarchaeosortase [Candidatus Nitrosopolaris sp.]|nr:thaumarchaeosortase [Candidatus Nitrosopolaris sp.]
MFDKGKRSLCGVKSNQIFGLSPCVAVILVLIVPILFSMIAYPSTFKLSWNEGRGGFLFAMAFISAEIWGLQLNVHKKEYYVVIFLSVLTIGYFIALPLGLRNSIISAAPFYKVQLVNSWIWMWDFVVMAIYVLSSQIILFGKKWHKIASAGAIYLAGSALILSLDTFFPYDSLGPLQIIVPSYLQIDQWVVRFLGNHVMSLGPGISATAQGNLLMLNGLHGYFALKVFWPSAGVHSMIIYSLVMLAFLLKMDIPIRRKLVYFGLGVIGTASVNVIRIISLSLFALIITTNVAEWETFHSLAGEIMFLPWLGIYLGTVISLENKRARNEAQVWNAASISSDSSAHDASSEPTGSP